METSLYPPKQRVAILVFYLYCLDGPLRQPFIQEHKELSSSFSTVVVPKAHETMDQVTDSVNNSGGLAFVQGCNEGFSCTESTVWVRGDCFPRHVEVVTKFPVFGNLILASVDQCSGRVYLNIGLIVPKHRTLCYPENGEYPQGRGQLYAWRSKQGQIYSKTYDFNCNNGNSPQKPIAPYEYKIAAGVTLRIYCYVKEEGLYFSINGKEQFVSTCGKQELNSCYGFMRLGCDDNDSKIQVSLFPGINDEAAPPVVGSRENVTAPSNTLADLPISVGRKSHETLAEVVSLETAPRNTLRDLPISVGPKISEAFAKVGSLETAPSEALAEVDSLQTEPRNTLRDLPISVGLKISEATSSEVGSRETAPRNTLRDLPISVGRKIGEENQQLSSYRMSLCGNCLVINNVKDLTSEENSLEKLFTSLGFHVKVKQNLSMTEILKVAQEFGEEDHSSYDSFVFIVLSQCGPGELIVGVDGRDVSLKDIMREFRPRNPKSTSLKNKPKLFFVLRFVNSKTQSAESRNGGSREICMDATIALPQSCNTFTQEVCPEEADFLLACVTSPIVKGKKIKQPEHSFTEMMVNAVSTYHQTNDLLEMLTLLNKHWTDNLHKKNGQSNVMVTHTLRYKVRFDSVQTHEPQISTQSSIPGLPSLSRYDEHKTECPGYCLIINNRQFQGNEVAYREGSEQDVERLRNLFESLRFEVIIKKDLKRDQIEGVAQEYGGKKHDKFVAFVLIVMSHGDDKDCILGVDNKPASVRALMREFQADRCPSLKGKPKILIIQTCRGSRQCDVERSGDFVESINADPTEFYLADNRVDPFSLDSSLSKSVFPPEADFLLAFATVPGYVSFRSPTSGAFFIQELVEVVEKYHGSHHLLDMLTEVTRRVIDHQNREFDPARDRVQVPAPTHTLTKLLYL